MNTTMTTPRLVRVASFVNSAQADLARMQLAMEDIPAYLGNAVWVTWFWHYSNATGGARVYVSSSDTERAVAVLRQSRETVPAALPPWTCMKCGEHVDVSWNICWHCGTSTDGEEDPNFYEQPVVLPFPLKCSQRTWSTIIGVSGPLLFFVSHGSLALLMEWFAVVAVMLTLRTCWPTDEDRTEPATETPDLAAIDLAAETTEQDAADGYTAIEETVLRAWQAAVLSLSFPPLALYAIWLLLRLDLPEEPLKSREQRRYLGAWVFSMLPIAAFGLFTWLPFHLR